MNINDVLFKVSLWTPRQAFIYGAVLAAIYFFVGYDNGDSLLQNLNNLRQAVSLEESKEQESELALKEVEIVKASLEALGQQYQILSRELPRELSPSQIIKIVDTLAATSGVQIRSKAPQASRKMDAIEEYPLTIEGKSDFKSIMRFVKLLVTEPMILRIRSANFMRSELERDIQFKMEISSFRFIGEGT
ncbi:MAG: type 4a pilus biogenesis protein PilO [Bdellovibrionaceae bacterium]|nr:type 4a pilus biogenesis protein PilO [Pseudobdellovibrionaceae bacterium]